MRLAITALAILALAAGAACSKSDTETTQHDLKAAGNDVSQDVHKLAANPDMAKVGTDLKHMGAEAGHELRKDADAVKAGVKTTAADAKRSSQDLAKPKDSKSDQS